MQSQILASDLKGVGVGWGGTTIWRRAYIFIKGSNVFTKNSIDNYAILLNSLLDPRQHYSVLDEPWINKKWDGIKIILNVSLPFMCQSSQNLFCDINVSNNTNWICIRSTTTTLYAVALRIGSTLCSALIFCNFLSL